MKSKTKIPSRREKTLSSFTIAKRQTTTSPVVSSPCVFKAARHFLTKNHGLSPRPAVTGEVMRGPPPSMYTSLPNPTHIFTTALIDHPAPMATAAAAVAVSPVSASPSPSIERSLPFLSSEEGEELLSPPLVQKKSQILEKNPSLPLELPVLEPELSERETSPPPSQAEYENHKTTIDLQQIAVGGPEQPRSYSVPTTPPNSTTTIENSITFEKIIYSSLNGDMFVLMKTPFDDHFLTYYSAEKTANEETVEKFANIPTTLTHSHLLKSGQDAENLGILNVAERAGVAAGHIRPEVDMSKGGLIGAAVLEESTFRTKLCAVLFLEIYSGRNIEKNVTFMALVSEELQNHLDDDEDSQMSSSAQTQSTTYPVILAESLEQNEITPLIQSVHAASSMLRDKDVLDMRNEAMAAVADARVEIQNRLTAFLDKSKTSCSIRDQSETAISDAMKSAAMVADAISYEDLAMRFKAHRMYASRVNDSVSKTCQLVIDKLDEISRIVSRSTASLYVDSRMVLSPDLAGDFLEASKWGYNAEINCAMFGNIGPAGGIVDDEGNRIRAADLEHPELVKAAIESADLFLT